MQAPLLSGDIGTVLHMGSILHMGYGDDGLLKKKKKEWLAFWVVDAEIQQQLSEFRSMYWHRWQIIETAGLHMQCKTLMQIMAQNLICKYEENSECREVFVALSE